MIQDSLALAATLLFATPSCQSAQGEGAQAGAQPIAEQGTTAPGPSTESGALLRILPVPVPEPQGYLGVRIAPHDGGGVSVVGIEPGSPAEAAGLQVGDRIRALNGADVRGPDHLVELVAGMAPGSVVRLGLRRGDAELDLEATLSGRERGTRLAPGSGIEEFLSEDDASLRRFREDLRAREHEWRHGMEQRWSGLRERFGAGRWPDLEQRLDELRAERQRRFERFLDSVGELDRERRALLDELRERVQGDERGPGLRLFGAPVPAPAPPAVSIPGEAERQRAELLELRAELSTLREELRALRESLGRSE